jgi:hypothetical protein
VAGKLLVINLKKETHVRPDVPIHDISAMRSIFQATEDRAENIMHVLEEVWRWSEAMNVYRL